MKLFYLLLLVCCITTNSNAQIVNIPDPNFKATLISLGIDTNSDGQIQQTEAEAKTGQLAISTFDYSNASYITNLTGINAFKNITEILTYGLYNLSSLQISGLTNLQTLNLNGTGTSTFFITITGCPAMRVFWSSGVNGMLNLDFLNTLPNLEMIQIDRCDALNLTVHDLPKLNYISWFRNGYTLDPCKVNLYNLPLLTTVIDQFSSDTLILNNLPKLVSYSGFNYGLGYTKYIAFNNVPKLEDFRTGVLDMVSVDFSNCPKLIKLDFDNSVHKLRILNIKNGAILNTLNVSNAAATDSLKVCVDEGEASYVQNRLTQQGFDINKIMVSPFCTFTEGGTYNTIKGVIKFDGNVNGCDAGDEGMKQLNIVINEVVTGNFVRSSDSLGNYEHYTGKGTYTITPQFNNPYFTVTPTSASAYFDSANNYTATRDFCITANGTKHDLEVAFLPTWQPARPGFDAGYALLYKNNGNTTQSGTVQMNYNASKLTFVNESTGTVSQTPGQLNWGFTNLKPFETRTINITLNVLPPTANNIGDTLLFNAVIGSANTDETPANNTNNIKQPVQGSFDPNDKQCLEGNRIAPTELGNNMHYQIRFQNEGTDTAFNIIVADTLKANYDETSFQLLSSSHPCTIKRKGNIIHFNFSNIKLPYKAINEPASHGYVSFTVKPKNILVAGDSLNNKASIYFDFNLPIVTNTSVTVVNTAALLPIKFEYLNGQIDGSANKLQWKINCDGVDDVTLQIERSTNGTNFEIVKTMTATAIVCQQPFSYTDYSMTATKNYYRIKVIENSGSKYYSGIVLLEQKAKALQIQNVRTINGAIAVTFNASTKKEFDLGIYSADGKLVSQKTIKIPAGTTTVEMPVKNIASGVYMISAKGNDVSLYIKQYINTKQ